MNSFELISTKNILVHCLSLSLSHSHQHPHTHTHRPDTNIRGHIYRQTKSRNENKKLQFKFTRLFLLGVYFINCCAKPLFFVTEQNEKFSILFL